MKLKCDKLDLTAAAVSAARAAAAKSPIADLEGILLRADTGLQLTGYDMEKAIVVSIDAEVAEPGALVLPARVFCDIVRKLPDSTIEISSEESGLTTISCGRAKFRIMAISDGCDYPELPDVDAHSGIEMPQSDLRDMISGTIFSVSENQGRPVHTGCLIEADGDTVTMVAVDGFRLAKRSVKTETPLERPMKFVVPAVGLREVEKMLNDAENSVKLLPDSKNIMFKIGNSVLICRLLEGEFLDWRRVVPVNNPIVMVADVATLLSCVERVSLIVSEKIKTPVRCVFGENRIDFQTRAASSEAKDACVLAGDGKDVEIGFNCRYLMDALRAIPTEEVTLEISNPLSPIVLTPADEKSDFAYMVLPVRLKAED